MSDLLQQIRSAQVHAGEDAVIAHLQSMGLARAERDAPVALAASLAAQAQTRELNNLRTERDTLLNALRQIALTEACSNSDPEEMGRALDNAVAIAQGALRACQHHKTRPVAPEAAAIGAGLDPESIEQGDL
ncbi:hypothetical protein LJR074_002153 [Acidovorax sp. LjRoot74]|uniref:hypothetical protein n=1 Tax=Acidovorax sp. LjRoot74 TaxID=3342337 RepID=UPI003ECD671E